MIPFNRPFFAGQELACIEQAVRDGHTSGNGPFTQRCVSLLASVLGSSRVLLTTSCTHALEMAAMLLDVEPGDEVIVPSFTFVSTASAFCVSGAKPVFADIRPDTLNMDMDRVHDLIGNRTRAVVPVHYAGIGCDVAALQKLASSHGIALVEDNAHGLFAKRGGKYLGTFGCMAAQSFHETKNITSGEGGALVVNDPELFERAEIIRDKGTNRQSFFRGQVDKYTWVDTGSSFAMSDLLAAFLYAQLGARREIQNRRRRIWDRYYVQLQDWAQTHDVRLPIVPEDCEQSYHMFYMLMPTLAHRDRLLDHLRQRGICAVFHYQPLHISPMGRRFGGRAGDCPVTEDVAGRLLRLPFYTSLGEAEQEIVLDGVRSYPF